KGRLRLAGYLLQPAQTTTDVVRVPVIIPLEEGKRRSREERAAKIRARGSTGRVESRPWVELPIGVPVSHGLRPPLRRKEKKAVPLTLEERHRPIVLQQVIGESRISRVAAYL